MQGPCLLRFPVSELPLRHRFKVGYTFGVSLGLTKGTVATPLELSVLGVSYEIVGVAVEVTP